MIFYYSNFYCVLIIMLATLFCMPSIYSFIRTDDAKSFKFNFILTNENVSLDGWILDRLVILTKLTGAKK